MRARWYIRFLTLASFLALIACASAPRTVSLPPQFCKPASDLTQPKFLKRLPEVATTNDQFYSLFLMERSDHAGDITDFNSLLRTCVDPTLPEHFPIFAN